MTSLKDVKLAQKSAAVLQQLIADLEALVKDLERCERTITQLRDELVQVNGRYPTPRSTQQDVDYLTELLKCANKKLVWEKQVTSLQKRTPLLMDKLVRVLEDPSAQASEAARAEVLRVMQQVQAAVARLQAAKGE